MAMNAMSEKSDWYSVLCTFFRMASVSEEDEMYQPVSDMLQRIESIDTKELLLCELNALEDIIQKKPNIYTMRREIQKDCDLIIRKYKDIDPSIYGILRKN